MEEVEKKKVLAVEEKNTGNKFFQENNFEEARKFY